jgi:hypothetical protein
MRDELANAKASYVEGAAKVASLSMWGLSPTEITRIKRIAQLRAKMIVGVDWRDLLHEALIRVADGRRRAGEGVPTVVVLVQTMRSIAAEHRRRGVLETCACAAQPFPGDTPSPSPEEIAVWREELARICSLFGADPAGLKYVTCLSLGMSGTEARYSLKLSDRDYEAVRKRVRRRIIRYLAEGY